MRNPRKQPEIVKLPEGINPDSLLTMKKAEEISGLTRSTIYKYVSRPGIGIKFYQLGSISRRKYLKAGEFFDWLNLHLKEVTVDVTR